MRLRISVLVTIGFGGLVFLACTQPGAVEQPVATSAAVPPSRPAAPEKPAFCPATGAGALQDIGDTPASPYFVHHPTSGLGDVPTVIFIPGGAGLQRNARRAWENYLADGQGIEPLRIIIPYSVGFEYLEEFPRTFAILDEVLACYGGDPGKVHVAGVSNGGLAAFALMLQQPERFATLLGAPGEFPDMDPAAWSKALAGKAVFNGVGEHDTDWKPEVKETHAALVGVGIDSVYVEFPGQGHTVRAGFDQRVLFDFWLKHSALQPTSAPDTSNDMDCR
ncbi:MAG: hypothetical protein HY689_10555 [Chloroflexi bacterium]|nr:hypothetical protein [Chloroflexota bacterium]